jgi:hypothetical protein
MLLLVLVNGDQVRPYKVFDRRERSEETRCSRIGAPPSGADKILSRRLSPLTGLDAGPTSGWSGPRNSRAASRKVLGSRSRFLKLFSSANAATFSYKASGVKSQIHRPPLAAERRDPPLPHRSCLGRSRSGVGREADASFPRRPRSNSPKQGFEKSCPPQLRTFPIRVRMPYRGCCRLCPYERASGRDHCIAKSFQSVTRCFRKSRMDLVQGRHREPA